jgi:hypothetical protein
MAAPTISAYSNSTVNDRPPATTETTGSVSWNNGDLVVVLGVSEDNAKTFATPTTGGTGLTFSALSGTPSNVASSCKIYGWSATASATSSGTISSVVTGATSYALFVWVLSGHGGIGNVAVSSATDTTDPYTVSLTRSGSNSAVLMAAGDWNATSAASTTPSPSTGSTERIGDNAGLSATFYNVYAANWADEGAAGTTSYGVTLGAAGGIFTLIAVEVLGTSSGVTMAPSVGAVAFTGRGTALGFVINMPDEP